MLFSNNNRKFILNSKGFTLIEMLTMSVVIAIVSTISYITFKGGDGTSDYTDKILFVNDVQRLKSTINRAMNLSQSNNSIVSIRFYPNTGIPTSIPAMIILFPPALPPDDYICTGYQLFTYSRISETDSNPVTASATALGDPVYFSDGVYGKFISNPLLAMFNKPYIIELRWGVTPTGFDREQFQYQQADGVWSGTLFSKAFLELESHKISSTNVIFAR